MDSDVPRLRAYRANPANRVGYHDAGLIDIGGFLNNFATGNYGKQFKFWKKIL